MIIAPWPEMRYLLFDASSQANILRQGLHHALPPLERLLHPIGLDVDVALGIDEVGTVGSEHRADRVDRVGGLAEAEADWGAGLEELLGGDDQRLPVPLLGLRSGGLVHRVHRLDVDAGVLLEELEAHARRLDLGAGDGGYRDPLAAGLAQEFGRGRHLAVGLDQRIHHVVERLELLRVRERVPGGMRQDVVAGARLRLGGDGQHVLVALGGDVVDLDVDRWQASLRRAKCGCTESRWPRPMRRRTWL